MATEESSPRPKAVMEPHYVGDAVVADDGMRATRQYGALSFMRKGGQSDAVSDVMEREELVIVGPPYGPGHYASSRQDQVGML